MIDLLAQFSQVATAPALVYLVVLERRLVKLETQLEYLIATVSKGKLE